MKFESMRDEKQAAHYEVIRRVALSGRQEEAFIVLDANRLASDVEQWKEGINKGGIIAHDVSLNCSGLVLRALRSLGCLEFHCHNKAEVAAAVASGIDVEQIVLDASSRIGPALTKGAIKAAAKEGVFKMAFGNRAELGKIKALVPNARLTLACLVRCISGQFVLEEDEVLNLLGAATEMGMSVDRLTFYLDEENMEDNNLESKEFSDKFQALVSSFLEANEPRVKSVQIKGDFKKGEMPLVSAHTLPASALASSSTLAVRIIGKTGKRSDHAFSYVVNDGLFGCLSRCMMLDELPEPRPLLADCEVKADFATELWGSSGDDRDVLGCNFRLPEMEVGDWLVFEAVGASTVSAVAPVTYSAPIRAPAAAFGDTDDDKWIYLKGPQMLNKAPALAAAEELTVYNRNSVCAGNNNSLFRNDNGETGAKLVTSSCFLDYDFEKDLLAEMLSLDGEEEEPRASASRRPSTFE